MLHEIWVHIRPVLKALFSGLISFWVILALLLKPIGLPFAVLTASGIAFFAALIAALLPRILKKVAVSFAQWVIARALTAFPREAEVEGIDGRSGNVIVRLAVGLNESVSVGDKFDVVNNASRQVWGTVEVIEVEDSSCLCEVYNRENEEFWKDLEERMGRDPSPPLGVTFSLLVPDEHVDFVSRIIRTWGR